MGNCMTECRYEFLRCNYYREKAGLKELDYIPDIDVITRYRDESSKLGIGDAEFITLDGGLECITSQIGSLQVYSALLPDANSDIEIMRHHLGVAMYRRYFMHDERLNL
ncbi:hypothetical protein [Citrobacter phage vB_CfrS_K1M]